MRSQHYYNTSGLVVMLYDELKYTAAPCRFLTVGL